MHVRKRMRELAELPAKEISITHIGGCVEFKHEEIVLVVTKNQLKTAAEGSDLHKLASLID